MTYSVSANTINNQDFFSELPFQMVIADSPMNKKVNLLQVYHHMGGKNLLQLHKTTSSIEHKTPARKAGIKISDGNKWLSLIEEGLKSLNLQ